ncbi:16S rRNA (guanine(527)-N(7))-methyltransferase RsmG [Candidatus Gracilibacteria bacterium CG17_big_fil_post_rev_8_21_14_2_50_48_13]|nr:MAG: 16S rRNA (guanine(527)-N(7))-methyltransferase RsmG [Candidatus Gracilibacteria bacterium CG17_big_fil_post_rev_8_21_14_2_50_48_13]
MQANSFNVLLKTFEHLGKRPTDAQLAMLSHMMDAYMERIHLCNFTAHRTEERFALFNMADSVLPVLLGLMQFQDGMKVADIGTGGGFPGVPFAGLFPKVQFDLFDSVGKKLRIIEDVAKVCSLTNLHTCHGRLEEYGQKQARASYDMVTSRAVAHWTTLLELGLPLLKVGGTMYAYQGEKIFADLDEKPEVPEILGARVQDIRPYSLAENGNRYIVVLTKVAPTPRMYPRMASLLIKSPL